MIDWSVIALFLFLMVRTYLRRKTAEEPRWMGRLQTADAGFSSDQGSTSARLASRQRPVPERLAGWSS